MIKFQLAYEARTVAIAEDKITSVQEVEWVIPGELFDIPQEIQVAKITLFGGADYVVLASVDEVLEKISSADGGIYVSKD